MKVFSNLTCKRYVLGLSIGFVLLAGSLVLADPCYRRTGGQLSCWDQGGTVCSSILPTGLSCEGGPWYASTPRVNINDSCEARHVPHLTPKKIPPQATMGQGTWIKDTTASSAHP
jgi:hypothetical protein